MSRIRLQMEKALAAKGYTVDFSDWSAPVQMDKGILGGWCIYLNETSEPLLGLNSTDIFRGIERLPIREVKGDT